MNSPRTPATALTFQSVSAMERTRILVLKLFAMYRTDTLENQENLGVMQEARERTLGNVLHKLQCRVVDVLEFSGMCLLPTYRYSVARLLFECLRSVVEVSNDYDFKEEGKKLVQLLKYATIGSSVDMNSEDDDLSRDRRKVLSDYESFIENKAISHYWLDIVVPLDSHSLTHSYRCLLPSDDRPPEPLKYRGQKKSKSSSNRYLIDPCLKMTSHAIRPSSFSNAQKSQRNVAHPFTCVPTLATLYSKGFQLPWDRSHDSAEWNYKVQLSDSDVKTLANMEDIFLLALKDENIIHCENFYHPKKSDVLFRMEQSFLKSLLHETRRFHNDYILDFPPAVWLQSVNDVDWNNLFTQRYSVRGGLGVLLAILRLIKRFDPSLNNDTKNPVCFPDNDNLANAQVKGIFLEILQVSLLSVETLLRTVEKESRNWLISIENVENYCDNRSLRQNAKSFEKFDTKIKSRVLMLSQEQRELDHATYLSVGGCALLIYETICPFLNCSSSGLRVIAVRVLKLAFSLLEEPYIESNSPRRDWMDISVKRLSAAMFALSISMEEMHLIRESRSALFETTRGTISSFIDLDPSGLEYVSIPVLLAVDHLSSLSYYLLNIFLKASNNDLP